MHKINRRSFISKTTAAAGAALVLTQLPEQLLAAAVANDMPIGFQTFPIRENLGKDFPGTLKMMADMGYTSTEMCSPKGYAQIGFGTLAAMKTSDIKKTINKAGLSCISCHFGFGEFADDKLDESIAFAQEMGLTQMICSTFGYLKLLR